MAHEPSSPTSATLQPPQKSVELEDPGAHELVESENEDDHFSDAPEAAKPASPIPTTRVEKVDDIPSHGQVPGTTAYEMRTKDAVADEMEVIPEGARSRSGSRSELEDNRASSPGGAPIPITVVETVDPVTSETTQLSGTTSHEKHKADAVPDIVLKVSENEPGASNAWESQSESGTVNQPIPTTVVSKVNAKPSYGEVPGTDAYDMRKEDAEPDVVEEKGDVPVSPTSPLHRSDHRTYTRRKRSISGSHAIADDGGFGPMHYEVPTTYQAQEEDDDGGFGDDFDDFEQGEGDEDFGGFDEGIQKTLDQESQIDTEQDVHQSLPSTIPSFPIFDYGELGSIEDFLFATTSYFNEIFPDTDQDTSPSTSPNNTSEQNSIFLTERSLSLWSQLVAPPPLQPPNWVRSRIRRLFLVSLGVPVDLDEILPASKQKKLILPSIHLHADSRSPGPSSDSRPNGSVAKLKQQNGSSASVDSTKGGRRRKGRPPVPELDLGSTRMLCTVTDAALTSFTDEELRGHIQRLQELTSRASEVLEYWLQRKDEAVGDKEAFEGVIENLVKHARKVRK